MDIFYLYYAVTQVLKHTRQLASTSILIGLWTGDNQVAKICICVMVITGAYCAIWVTLRSRHYNITQL